ncbi:transcriptional regulator [Knoellia subterranea KCTC 19937]|uniref:Transcriptional regulator n=1 Tax=Knoellia subterranea KCTC 19937 TaxID=1385521 RepID=A0A0A0JL79_9MICO|nr:transcriptional regulator [Knoellia subterranea KCTC 19937]
MPVGTLRWWRHRKVGPRSFKLGRSVRYKKTDVDAWLRDQYEAEGASA